MRTTVHTNIEEPHETDTWAGCIPAIDEDGELDIVEVEEDGIVSHYAACEWVSVTTTNDQVREGP